MLINEYTYILYEERIATNVKHDVKNKWFIEVIEKEL